MPYLCFYRRGQELLHLDLSQLIRPDEPLVVGSQAGNYVVPDAGIAPTQFEIAMAGDRYRLTDRSGEKTVVDGAPVESALLGDGAIIRLGGFALQYYSQLPEGVGGTDAPLTLTDAFEKPELPKALWVTAQHKDGRAPVRIDLTARAVIGSAPDCDLRLEGRTVSAHHAELLREDGVIRLRDLESTNGTRIGGLRAYDLELPLGTRVRVGDWEVWVSGRDNATAAAPRPVMTAGGLVTADPRMLALLEQVDVVAKSDCAVLIEGETGTGKELLALAIHERSKRAGEKLVTFNCGIGRSAENFSTQLFGAEKGSHSGATSAQPGTLAVADGGTVFLDELRDMPLASQPSLLRAVDKGEIHPLGAPEPRRVDVRYICATRYDLAAASRDGEFREDLYYRLAVVVLTLPPLRQRKGDILLLWDYFTRKLTGFAQGLGLTDAARAKLLAHDWPGNVRELWNTVNRALLFTHDNTCEEKAIIFDRSLAKDSPSLSTERTVPAGAIDLRNKTWPQIESDILSSTMLATHGNRSEACRRLDVDPKRLRRMLEEYGLERVGLKDGEKGE